MKNLWAPWRRKYVTQPGGGSHSCFLCEAAGHGSASKERGIVYVDGKTIIVLNKYPYSSGHLLVAPKVHCGDILTLDAQTYLVMMDNVRIAVRALTDTYQPHGLNIGMNLGSAAGAGVPDHCHIHIVPRWNGDTNFMPVLSDTKVSSESLDDTWARLSTAIESMIRGTA